MATRWLHDRLFQLCFAKTDKITKQFTLILIFQADEHGFHHDAFS